MTFFFERKRHFSKECEIVFVVVYKRDRREQVLMTGLFYSLPTLFFNVCYV